MESIHEILFWGCFGILIYIYLGYFLVLGILVRLCPFQHQPDESYTPTVTLLFSAYNEIESLPGKMQSIQQLHYPKTLLQVLIASDASTDGTNEFLSRQSDIQFVQLDERHGKNNALNMLLPKATGEILFFTDANTILHPDCIKAVVQHFHDPQVGGVVGELIFSNQEDWNSIGQGVGLYWKYETTMKRLESRLGSLLVGGGALLVFRRDLVEPLHLTIANDLEIPTKVGSKGFKILYEPACQGYEKAHTRIREEWRRTSRIVSRGIKGFCILFSKMVKNPLRFWQFVSHKVLRWFTLVFLLITLESAWMLRDQWIPFMVLSLGGLFFTAAGIGVLFLAASMKSRYLRLFTVPAHFIIMHVAALWGIGKAIWGKTPATWTVPESTRK